MLTCFLCALLGTIKFPPTGNLPPKATFMFQFSALTLVLSLLPSIALAQSKAKPAPKKSQDIELKTLLAKRGSLLFKDDFTAVSFKKNWRQGAGQFKIVDDALRLNDKPREGHHPYAGHRIDLTDAIIQFRFRFESARTMFVGLDRKGAHVARIVIQPRGFRIQRTVGIGKTTKSTVVDKVAYAFKPGRWYTMLWEIRGKEMVAQVDNRCVVFGAIDGIDVGKLQIQLMSTGGAAWYDQLRIWKAEDNPAWKKTRLKLKAKKKPVEKWADEIDEARKAYVEAMKKWGGPHRRLGGAHAKKF